MSRNEATNESGVAMYELSGSELDAVAGGAGLLGLLGINIESQSSFDILSHWKEGMLVEQVSQYQSVSAGTFSLNL